MQPNLAYFDAKFCTLEIAEFGGEIWQISFVKSPKKSALNAVLREAISEFEKYFCGEISNFSLRLHDYSFSPFANAVYSELLSIPYAQTAAYSEISERMCAKFASNPANLGFRPKPNSQRAVANACGKNPFPIVIPCHRAVAKNGLGGYCGRENLTEIKRFLLDLESRNLGKNP